MHTAAATSNVHVAEVLLKHLGVEVIAKNKDNKHPWGERHPKEAACASKLLGLISGPYGFNRSVKFAVECDFAVACNRMIRMQDKPSADIALNVTEVTECLEICYVLFDEGHAFDFEDNHT